MCNLVFIVPLHAARRAMAAAGFLNMPCPKTIDPSGAPLSPYPLIRTAKEKKNWTKETKEPVLPSSPPPKETGEITLVGDPAHPRPPLLPEPLDRGGPWVFPLARLPYVPPQSHDLGAPGSALCEQVMAGLFLFSPAPPTLVVHRLVDLVYGPIAAWPDSSW